MVSGSDGEATAVPAPQATGAPGSGRRSGRNAIWLMLERVTHLGVAFLVTIVVARELGPADYGRLALGIALMMLLMPISNIASQCLMRDTTAEPRSANMLLSSAEVAAGVVTSSIVVAITVGVMLTVGVASTEGIIVLVIVGSSLLRPLQVVDSWFIMNQASRKVVLIRVSVVLVTGIIRVALPLAGYGVVSVAWTYVAESALASIGSWIAYRHFNKNFRWEVNRARVYSVLKEYVPLLLVSSTALIYQRLDQVMLAWLSDFRQTGVFAAASSLSDAPKFPLIALALSFTPRLLALRKADPERYKVALDEFARFVNMFAYAITFGLILVMAPLTPLLLGPAYHDAAFVIIILALSTPLAAVGATLLLLTNWDKLYREAIIRNLGGAAISVGLNLLLMPRFGAIGGAISTFAALMWVFVIGAAVDRRTRHISRITLPTLDPISSTRILRARWRERQEEKAFMRGMGDV